VVDGIDEEFAALRCRRWDSSEVSTWTDQVRWTRVPSASLEELGRHRVFATDTNLDVNVRPEVADAAREVWRREHLDPIDVDDEIRAAADARRDADAQLDAAVARARRVGRSWADIGGCSRDDPTISTRALESTCVRDLISLINRREGLFPMRG
jgi:hypothetical protein